MRCKHLLPLFALGFLSLSAQAERRDITVLDRSTTGLTVKINVGQRDGLHMREAIMVRDQENKLVAARIIALQEDSSVAYIVEAYAAQRELPKGGHYNILYGIPLGNIPDLPDNISDTLAPNPQDEKFFSPEGKEFATTPDIDSDTYQPEFRLRPNFPEKKSNVPHNLTGGIGLFRNVSLNDSTTAKTNTSGKAFYQGYALRYQYNFRSSLWMDRKVPIWIGLEMGWGVYSFNQTFINGNAARISIMPISGNIKYIWELNKFLRAYPYMGYQNNLVSATDASNSQITSLRGGSIMAGAGMTMLMSESIDARADIGTDGALLAAVVKF